jgi:ubiquitin-conjugating enzyme E2 D/E
MLNNSRIKRLQNELKEIQKNPPDNCSADIVGGDINKWKALILGPIDSPYEGGLFYVSIEFNENYPFSPPICKFMTYVYHPNIDRYGNICLDILKNNWTPAISVSKLLISICSLLDDPNPDDPLDLSVSHMYKNNIIEFKRMAREYTLRYASEFR